MGSFSTSADIQPPTFLAAEDTLVDKSAGCIQTFQVAVSSKYKNVDGQCGGAATLADVLSVQLGTACMLHINYIHCALIDEANALHDIP